MPNIVDLIRDHEARILELEKNNGRIWTHIKRWSAIVVRISSRLPEGRLYERGSNLIIPKRPTQMLRDAGIVFD
jgi:hypothetical protein